MFQLRAYAVFTSVLVVLSGCEKSNQSGSEGTPEAESAAEPGSQAPAASGTDESAGEDQQPAAPAATEEPSPTDEPEPAANTAVARGEYLVTVVMGCGNCHSPRDETGQPIPGRHLAGISCEGEGCRTVPNLTNHETGLADTSDAELAALIFDGRRPDGEGLRGMPSAFYHNVNEADRAAIIAYLRSVPGVDHEVPHREHGPEGPPEPPTPVDLSAIPAPAEGSADYDSAMRGRYLAVNTGACVGCHTPEAEGEHGPDFSRAFAGGHGFPAARMGLPVPPFPAEIVSSNLTPDETGLANWTAEDVVRALHEGVEPDGGGICPPMPSGPHGPYARITDEDALDIAHYLASLPPVEQQVEECDPPPAPAPTE